MWHAFSFFTDIAPLPALNSRPLPTNCRLEFCEHIVRYFKEDPAAKTKGARRALIEERPGITLERRQAADGWRINVRHIRKFDATQTLDGSLFCPNTNPHTPSRWQFREEFSPSSPLTPALLHDGNFSQNTITHTTAPDNNHAAKILRKIPAKNLVNLHALIANFPDKLPPEADLVVMEDASLFSRDASFIQPSSTLANHDLPQKHKLTVRILNYSGGTPIEFWLNQHNTPQIVVFSPTRLFRLERIENL